MVSIGRRIIHGNFIGHFLSASAPAAAATHSLTRQFVSFGDAKTQIPSSKRLVNFKVQAAKLPAGVELPKAEPKLQPPFWGFTRNAEIWNSRACMIGLIGTFIVELILNKGILQIIGVEVGKGLDLPL